jgi:hypothetical protein
MKIFYYLVISALTLFQSCEKNINIPNNNFAASVVQTGVLKYLDTGAFGVLLTYIDDGSGSFTSSNLQIQRRTPSFVQ